MRHFRRALWFLAVVAVCGCGVTRKTSPKPPLVTEKGTPTGQAATGTIGPAGGEVASHDAALTLTFPAGALAASTTVTIQPVVNHAPGGLGTGFRLSPEGQTFASPVTLTFHYSEADLAGTAAEALGVAYQDEQGVWRSLKALTLDAAAKTLSVTTTHFSDWSKVSGFQLRPAAGAVDVNRQLLLEVDFCQSQDQGDGLATLLAACEPTGLFPVAKWSVNGIEGGNQQVGSIDEINQGVASYTSPARKPTSNPVAVSAETTVGKQKILLTSNITVGAPSRWVGRVTTDVNDDQPGISLYTTRTVADVTFAWDEASKGYLPTGTVSFEYLLKNLLSGCQTIGSANATVGPQDGRLSLSSDTDPPSYTGFGSTPKSVSATVTCPDGPAASVLVGSEILWWESSSANVFTVKPDGTIDDSISDGTYVHAWHFDPRP